MSSMEDFIQVKKRIKEQFTVPQAVSALKMDGGMLAYANAARTAASIQIDPSLLSAMTELQKYKKQYESAYKSVAVIQQTLNPVLEEYHRISEAVSVVRNVQESIQPITNYLKDIKPVLPDTKVFSQLEEIRCRFILQPTVLIGLQEAIEAQINASLWEYETEQDELQEPLADEIKEDILLMPDEEDTAGWLERFLEKWGEKGKAIIVSVLKSLLATILAGLITYWCEPVYKVVTPSFLLQEENVDTENKIEIPVNTEVHVWNDITNNFIEITYNIEGREYQGYMEQNEFNANTEKISDEVELEHIVFINEATQVLSEKWNALPEQVYSFLKDDTDLINGYLLKHYDILVLLDNEEFVETFERHCEAQKIEIPQFIDCTDDIMETE